MGLDVFVLRPPFGPLPGDTDRPVCRLEYDAYYCYLAQFLPQSSSTGRRLHDAIHAGDVHFEGANLAQLRGCLERARASLDAQPTSWKEYTGTTQTRTDPTPRKRYDVVDRERLRARIDTLLLAVKDAEDCGGRIFFCGE